MKQDILHTAEENSPYWGIKPTDRFLFLDGVTNYVDLGVNVAGQPWGFWLNQAKDWTVAFTLKNYYQPFYNGFFFLTQGATTLDPIDRAYKPFFWIAPGFLGSAYVGTANTTPYNSYAVLDLYNNTSLTGLRQYIWTYEASSQLAYLYVNGQNLRKINSILDFSNTVFVTSLNAGLTTIGNSTAGLPASQSFQRMDLGQFLVTDKFVSNPKDIWDFYHARFDRNKYPDIIKNNRLVDLDINNQTPSSGLVIPDLMGNCTATIINQTTPDYRLYY